MRPPYHRPFKKKCSIASFTRTEIRNSGALHSFENIDSVETYRKLVPVHDFELLRPYLERQRDSGAETLTTEEVVHYNRTSGTTGTPKDVPVTQKGVSETRQLSQLAAYALIQQTSIFTGKVFAIGGAAVEGHTSRGTPIGSASGLIYRQQSRFVRTRYAIPPESFDIQDSELRYVVMSIYGLYERKVSTMATANPSTFVRLLEVINNNVDVILDHIERGRYLSVKFHSFQINQSSKGRTASKTAFQTTVVDLHRLLAGCEGCRRLVWW